MNRIILLCLWFIVVLPILSAFFTIAIEELIWVYGYLQKKSKSEWNF